MWGGRFFDVNLPVGVRLGNQMHIDFGPVVQWIVRKSPELDIPVRFWTGLPKPAFPEIKIIKASQRSPAVNRASAL